MGDSGLYVLPTDSTGDSGLLQPLLGNTDDPNDAYFAPAWSADGHFLYYARSLTIATDSGPTYRYDLERLAYPNGQPELILENAVWPDLSPDGSKLSYLSIDPVTYGSNLYLADAGGKNPTPALASGNFLAVDAHFFSPDGSMVIFSAVSDLPPPTGLSWFDRLLGVKVAAAHSLPSDWWRVPTAGGQPERLTHILDTGLYGDYSPDGQHIAFLATSGIYVMNPDGSGLTRVSNAIAFGGMQWIP
ncbi:MAG: hypothetical protein L0332_01300 [Chloroflexi bacterium]|nr:hypothetical protein [Chloroflexota bacterium]MCI0577424.1 hypothetical protein [Chloroflexota bacterium]MCI0649480.1 hypothetical protein [Chloroflexota bacterium]MCI0725358.1 hypothetical protein [Chloroflexota bacterium]